MKKKTLPSNLPLRLSRVVIACSLAFSGVELAQADYSSAYAGFSLRTAALSAARMAASILASESTDDADGYPLPPEMLTGSGGPTGGGLIPVASNAPKTDGTLNKLGYCAWDNGSLTAAAGRIAGSLSLSVPTLAVVAPGNDGAFNTSCADVLAGAGTASNGAKADDFVVLYSTAQLRSLYSLHVGPAVADMAALNSIAASALRDGEVRLVKSDNTLKRWDATSSTWKSAGGGGFTPDSGANLSAGTDAMAGAAVATSPGANDGISYNIALGYNALQKRGGSSFFWGSQNVAIGKEALMGGATAAGNSGGGNVAIGVRALKSGTSGGSNIAIGYSALENTTTGGSNIAIGGSALLSNTIGRNQIAIGSGAQWYMATTNAFSEPNMALGLNALYGYYGGGNTGYRNIAIGTQAMYNGGGNPVGAGTVPMTGRGNLAVGYEALQWITSGTYNVAVGDRAGTTAQTAYVTTTGSFNTFLGAGSGQGTSTQLTNATALGASSAVTTSNTVVLGRTTDTTVIGATGAAAGNGSRLQVTGGLYLAPAAQPAISSSVAGMLNFNSGDNTLYFFNGTSWVAAGGGGGGGTWNPDAQGNLKAGTGAAPSITTGTNNIAVGGSSGGQLSSGSSNVMIGSGTGSWLSTHTNNTAVGHEAMMGTYGNNNTALGWRAMGSWNGVTGSYRIAIGYSAMSAGGGDDAVAIGSGAANYASGANAARVVFVGSNAGGEYNAPDAIGIGYQALRGVGSSSTGARNLAIGTYALTAASTGGDNVAIGYYALKSNTTGGSNTAIGTNSQMLNTTGSENVSVGKEALYKLTTGTSNLALGVMAMYGYGGNITGSHNIALGYQAMWAGSGNLSGSDNVAIGRHSLNNVTTGSGNIALGNSVGTSITTESDNVMMGREAGTRIKSSGNIAIGGSALRGQSGDVTGQGNVALGLSAMQGWSGPITGSYNLAIGTSALTAITGGSDNFALGYSAMSSESTGSRNLAVGRDALGSGAGNNDEVAIGINASRFIQNTAANSPNIAIGPYAMSGGYTSYKGAAKNNVAMGYQALGGTGDWVANNNENSLAIGYQAQARIYQARDNFAWGYQAMMGVAGSIAANTGYNNIAMGKQAMYGDYWGGVALSGHDNFAAGAGALRNLAGSSYNVAIGLNTLSRGDIGDDNIAVGQHALSNAKGAENIAIGKEAMRGVGTLINATRNIAIGSQAMYGWSGMTGGENIAIGSNSLVNLTTGSENVAMGNRAGSSLSSGANTVAIGSYANAQVGTGQNNTAIGALAGYTSNIFNAVTTGSNNTFVGYNSGFGSASQLDYATAIGAGSRVTTSNTIVLGRTTDITVIGDTAADTVNAGYGKLQVGGHVTPTGDNAYNLGSGSKRWAVVYAANGTIQTSDMRLKTNFATVDGSEAVKIVERMNPVRYNWSNPKDGPARKIGFIAQELAQVLPEVVHIPSADSSYYGVNYAEITAVLAAAVKKQQEVISAFSVKTPAADGKGIVLAINGMLEADVIRARQLEVERLKVKEVEADNVKAKSVTASKVLSGEGILMTGNGCAPIFSMEVGAIYDVRAMSAQGGWGSMRIGLSEAGPTVQDRKMSENGLGIELNVIGNQVCAISAVSQKVSAGWLRVL